MIIEAIRNFIRTCDCLKEFEDEIVKVNVDYLDEDATCYSIEEVPTEPIIKQYVNGDSIKQYQFTFASREPYGRNVIQNIANSSFYEDFAKWIGDQNKIKNLPILSGGMESQKIEVISNGYAFQTDEDQARYQIDLRLKYFCKA